MKSMKEEKWKDKALHGQYPKILEKPHVMSRRHSHHQQMVVK